MKKVLMVSCEGLGKGGVQSVMMSIVKNLSDEYLFDVLLFTDEVRYYDREFMEYNGVIFRIPRYNGSNLFRKKIDYLIRGFKIRKNFKIILKNNKYDVIHFNNGYESGIMIKIAKKMNIPVRIVHAHVIEPTGNIITNIINKNRVKKINKYATIKIGCSKEAIFSLFGNIKDYFVINNSFDESKYKYINKSNKRNLIITQIGSFNDNKNQLFTLNVFKELLDIDHSAILNLIGFKVDDYEQKIVDYINNNNLSEKVFLCDESTDNAKILADSFALILPSKKEGFGIVAIEAQAMGCFCYISNQVPNTVDCGGCIFLSLNDNPREWANKILEDYKKNYNKINIFNVDRFKTKTIIKKYQSIYGGNYGGKK